MGSLEPLKIPPAILPVEASGLKNGDGSADNDADSGGGSDGKRNIASFNDLLNSFPMIARQMQPGLERVFKEFHTEINEHEKAQAPAKLVRRSSTASSQSGSNGSIHSKYSGSNGSIHSNGHAPAVRIDEDERHLRQTLETAVTAAIDIFQLVDKQQLSLLGSTTNLTGPAVERLIERQVTEQLHMSVFSTICNNRNLENLELESDVHGMQFIDIAQVGVTIEDGRQGKKLLMKRLEKGVEEFRKLGVAGSPQESLEILVKTQQVVSKSDPSYEATEKSATTMNADLLVSLLIMVVIRSQIRHLQARLTYMRSFNFIDDVEKGEMGYALSTFEAILSYLTTDSAGLKSASRRNKRLWQATRKGLLAEVKSILDPSAGQEQLHVNDNDSQHNTQFSGASTEIGTTSEPSLAHIFPFQRRSSLDLAVRKPKRVSMDLESLSSYSFRSRSTTIDSRTGVIEGDVSIETLAQTQDSDGDSLLMMAVCSRQPEVLEYLLSLEEYFPMKFILEDTNSEGTTLLSAAVQSGNEKLVDIILCSIPEVRDDTAILEYFSKADIRGRTMAHHLFNIPSLIHRFGRRLPWRQKDRNGQTPLLALSRSYDHPVYLDMVFEAMLYATEEQNDGQPLCLDFHVDFKGNTLLHAVNEASLAVRILRHCNSDPNAANDKGFTPLMVASKYGRVDMIRVLFGDRRVDIAAKELRGMTAVELAKDDEVRNRIDDMVLVSNVPAADGRVTAVVRSFFVEDASIRLIIKSATRSDNKMISVTTCKRSLTDFENLARWLSLEHPASWLPSIFNFRSPFQIPSRPSRAALQDIQVRLDWFLKIMLAHSTFSAHELMWEFVLFPEIQPDMMAERSRRKAELRAENVEEEYEPVEDVGEVETFVGHARDALRGVEHGTKSLVRRVSTIYNCNSGMYIILPITKSNFDLFQISPLPSRSVPSLSRVLRFSHLPMPWPFPAFLQFSGRLPPTPSKSSIKISPPLAPPTWQFSHHSPARTPSSPTFSLPRTVLPSTTPRLAALIAGLWVC